MTMQNETELKELAPDVAPTVAAAAAGGGDDGGDEGFQNELREMAREALAQHGAIHPDLARGKNNPAWNAFRAEACALLRGGESIKVNHRGKPIAQEITPEILRELRYLFDQVAEQE
jgi:hypothetical protein